MNKSISDAADAAVTPNGRSSIRFGGTAAYEALAAIDGGLLKMIVMQVAYPLCLYPSILSFRHHNLNL